MAGPVIAVTDSVFPNKVIAFGPYAKPEVFDNVIIPPHTAFYSIETLNELQSKCATAVARVLRGEKAAYPISA